MLSPGAPKRAKKGHPLHSDVPSFRNLAMPVLCHALWKIGGKENNVEKQV